MALPCWVSRNGTLIAPSQANISIFNPVIYGAFGVYESIQLSAGVAFLLDDHLERLAESAAAIDLALPTDLATIGRWTYQIVAANDCRDAILRLFALGPSPEDGPLVFIWPEPPRALASHVYKDGVGAVTYQGERALPQAKSLNTLVNHMAKMRALQAGEHEGLLVDRHGCVTEGSTSNFFVVQGGTLVTARSADVLAGVTQQEVLKLADRLAITVKHQPIPLAERELWDEAFLTSTSRHVLPLVRVDGRQIGNGRPGPVTERLHGAFEEYFQMVLSAVAASVS